MLEKIIGDLSLYLRGCVAVVSTNHLVGSFKHVVLFILASPVLQVRVGRFHNP